MYAACQLRLKTQQRVLFETCLRPATEVRRRSKTNRIRSLSIVILAALGALGVAGCASDDKHPKTMTEWIQQPRVGESAR
jgi:hypothetical protein